MRSSLLTVVQNVNVKTLTRQRKTVVQALIFETDHLLEVSNVSYIVTHGRKSSSSSDRYKLKDRNAGSGQTKLHTLVDDEDPRHHFVEPVKVATPPPVKQVILKRKLLFLAFHRTMFSVGVAKRRVQMMVAQ